MHKAIFTDQITWNKNWFIKDETLYYLSRGEICVANFIPPANGARQGNYCRPKSQIIGVTDRQTDKLFDTIYRGMAKVFGKHLLTELET